MRNDFGTIIQIGDILVSEDVVEDFFACDYPVCKGVCCVVGDSGAPMDERETGPLERDYPRYSPLMSQKGRDAVRAKGFFEIDRDGDMVTPLVEESRECAFCHFLPGGECLCAIERCGCVKPASCSLYPIRVTRLTGGGLALNVHHWDICRPAFEKGRKDGTRVYQFLKKPLVDNFGEEFYAALEAAAEHILANK
ncbi:MAG: DUF3109 family protein [Bacteroidales bacterium]|nr:DUF3109 family protein [Bacteroidales bacterium]